VVAVSFHLEPQICEGLASAGARLNGDRAIRERRRHGWGGFDDYATVSLRCRHC